MLDELSEYGLSFTDLDWNYILEPIKPYIVAAAISFIIVIIVSALFKKIVSVIVSLILILCIAFSIKQNNAYAQVASRLNSTIQFMIMQTIDKLQENEAHL